VVKDVPKIRNKLKHRYRYYPIQDLTAIPSLDISMRNE